MTVQAVTDGSQVPADGLDEAAAGGAQPSPRQPSLSPSRAADFKTCPLLYRFRTIDRLPERTSPDQARGTLVHAVLERLFDLPAADRTPERAAELVAPEWARLVEEQPELAALFAVPPAADLDATPVGGAPTGEVADRANRVEEFVGSARSLLGGYFAVEDPRRLEPAERECLVQATVGDDLLIRGYVDRLDVSPGGDLRVVDYKTGGAPREAFEARALFQLKFYALVLWRTRGVVPRVLRLLYLKDAEVCDFTPDAEELARFERTLVALWEAIARASAAQDFRPQPSRLCGWCSHQAVCPAFGGTPPPYPAPAEAAADGPVAALHTTAAAPPPGRERPMPEADAHRARTD
ncbi:MAG TPA: PD-(D/E)XK nuclease family protein [Micromonosporaceae bacterium]|nr:PD-(D/E)XK nuclease family protein [Micromonosporaceae bacterium]